MGYGFTVKCSNCSYTNNFRLGIGMYDSCLEHISEFMHYRLKLKVRDLLVNHVINGYEFDRVLHRCSRCSQLCVRDVIEINYDDGLVFRNKIVCSRCKGSLIPIQEYSCIREFKCPDCGEAKLTIAEELMWD